MIALLQRVSRAEVRIDGAPVAAIGTGMVVLLGVARGDSEEDARRLSDKIRHLRIFPGPSGHPDLDVGQAGGSILCVSQFTLLADCGRGRRPSFGPAEEPARAKELWELFCELAAEGGIEVRRGVFGADMTVDLANEGPFTIHLDSAG